MIDILGMSAHTRKFINCCPGSFCTFQIQMSSFAGKPIFILHPIQCHNLEPYRRSFIRKKLPTIHHDKISMRMQNNTAASFKITMSFWAGASQVSKQCDQASNLVIILKPSLLFTCGHPLFHLVKNLLPPGCFLLDLSYLLFQLAQKVWWVFLSCGQ